MNKLLKQLRDGNLLLPVEGKRGKYKLTDKAIIIIKDIEKPEDKIGEIEQMGCQSEAQLEEQFIKKLGTLDYEFVKIKNYDELVENFRKELNLFNKKVLENRDMSDTEFNRVIVELTGKTVYQCAKILRDKIVLDRDD